MGKIVPVAEPDGREALSVSAPALDASQQPGFKVLEEDQPRDTRKIGLTLIAILIAIAVAYLIYLRLS